MGVVLLLASHVKQVLSALRVPLKERRLAVVSAAFSSFATESRVGKPDAVNSGHETQFVPLTTALGRMKPEKHPEVAAGRLTAEEVRVVPFPHRIFLLRVRALIGSKQGFPYNV